MGSSWSNFGACSRTCGIGNKKRVRSVITMRHCGGVRCEHKEESPQCTLGPCKVHCMVSDWSSYTKCSRSCNGGHKMKIRSIVRHPKHGGYVCPSLVEKTQCNNFECPQNCIATDFGDWLRCSKSCDGGKHSRHRKIIQKNAHGGKACKYGLAEVQTKSCNPFECPIDCVVSGW